MASQKQAQALSSATLRLLRPLIRLLLRHGISFKNFAELTKQVYVEVAHTEFALPGRKQTISRISILTGLTRKEVYRLVRNPAASEEEAELYNRAARVLTGWIRDTRFTDKKGRPASLPLDGRRSFTALVRRYSGDMPVRATLDELLRVGAVEGLKNGKVRLVTRGYVPQTGEPEKLHILGVDTADLISTIDHNLQAEPGKTRFQRKVMYDNVPQEAAEAFRSLSAKEAQKLLELLDRWLVKRDRDVTPSTKGTGRLRVGLGIYYLEERQDSSS